MQSYELLLSELLVAFGCETRWHSAETSTVVRAENSFQVNNKEKKNIANYSHANFRSDQLLKLNLIRHVDNKHPVSLIVDSCSWHHKACQCRTQLIWICCLPSSPELFISSKICLTFFRFLRCCPFFSLPSVPP